MNQLRALGPRVQRFWWWLGGIAGAGLLLRVFVVLVARPTRALGSNPYDGYVLAGDAFYYHYQGRALGQGLGYIDPGYWRYLDELRPSAYHPPLYSGFLGVLSKFGVTTVTGHRLASSLLGVASVVVIALVARRIAGDRAGLLAGAAAALYPQLWINDGMLLSETIAITATAVVLLAAYHCWTQPNLVTAALLGGSIGLAALCRSELALLFALAALPLIIGFETLEWKRRLQMVVVVGLVGVIVMGPWLVFTLTRFEKPVLMTTGSGAVLSAGSCDEVFYGEFIGYTASCFDGPWPGPEADESERDAVARKAGLDYLSEHKSRLPIVVAARVGRIWGVFKPGQTTYLDWWLEGRGKAASWLGLASFYLLMPFAGVGIVALHRRKIPIMPLVSLAIVVTLAAALSFGVTRYRAPAEVAIVVAAAVGIDAVVRRVLRVRAERGRSEGVVAEPVA